MDIIEHNKKVGIFRSWLLGRASSDPQYYLVLKALDVSISYHKGKRKGGEPEFSHQIMICLYLKSISALLLDPASVFIVALLHDTYEDYPESESKIRQEFPEHFDFVFMISKIRHGKKIPYETYFGEMKYCHVCSIVKLVDRISNISTMKGVFSEEKQKSYIDEVFKWFFPMLKFAKRKFPEQESAYENIKTILSLEIKLLS